MERSPDHRTTAPHQWRGQWCWTRKHLSRPWNYYAYFRRTIDLPQKPRTADIRISADARYTLYINGRRVHQGPARSWPHFQSYDELNVVDLLRPGRNAVCAIVHQFGVPTFFSVYRDASGFLVDGEIDCAGQAIPLHTPDGWLCRDAGAWRKDVTRLSVQLGFQEHFDADQELVGWMQPEYEPKKEDGWQEPWVAGPVGAHPWVQMEPRRVPLLADHHERFTQIVAQFRGRNARGYKITDDVYHLPLHEERRKEKNLLENPQAMLQGNDGMTTLPPPADGDFVMAVLDLETYRTGHIHLDIAEAAGDEIIDILYSEDLDRSQGPLIVGTGTPQGSEEATADRYRCRAGPQQWEAFHYKGFRYATLIFRNVEKPLKIRNVGVRQVHAAIEDVGSFECSDEMLNRIWLVGRETQRNCMFDSFVDCPWREQAQWWGDARVQGRVAAYAFGDSSLLERGIRLVAQSQDADGSLHSHPPADMPYHRLPDFMLTWVGTLWDHHLHTGRTDLARECLPVMHRLFDFFAGHENEDGLIGDFSGWWVFLDWQELYKKNHSAVLNMLYLQGLRHAASLSDLVGDDTSADRYTARAELLVTAIANRFWDESARIWRDGFDPDTAKPVEQTSQHAQALAILLDLKPETHEMLARDVLLRSARTRRGKVLTASPFFYAYVLEAMIKAGLRTEAVELIREKWGEMIDRGAVTFWEWWDVTIQSRCHAWSASPVYHLSQQVLGVVPMEPGWAKVRIAPVPADLDFARGIVPSPNGPVRVEWEKVEEDQLAVRVDLPDGMEAQFVSPLGQTRTLGPGGHEFHT
jgi:alpha-L-rhamnosidase